MNSATWMKFLAGVLLFGAWLALVLLHLVPPGPLVDAIGYTLVGLGIYHTSTSGAAQGAIAGALVEGQLPPAAEAAPAAAPGVNAVPPPAVQAPASAALQ